jgi:hypothetical protein
MLGFESEFDQAGRYSPQQRRANSQYQSQCCLSGVAVSLAQAASRVTSSIGDWIVIPWIGGGAFDSSRLAKPARVRTSRLNREFTPRQSGSARIGRRNEGESGRGWRAGIGSAR